MNKDKTVELETKYPHLYGPRPGSNPPPPTNIKPPPPPNPPPVKRTK